MKKLLCFLLALTLPAVPALAWHKQAWVDGVLVKVMPGPVCDSYWPNGFIVSEYSHHQKAVITIGHGTTTSALGAALDPFAGLAHLHGLSPYLTLFGGNGLVSAMSWEFDKPHNDMQILWGLPKAGDWLVLWDQNGRRLARFSGADLLSALTGGTQVPHLNLMIHSPQPFYAAELFSGDVFELSNLHFDAANYCP